MMKFNRWQVVLMAGCLWAMAIAPSLAGDRSPANVPKPDKSHKCPVCGMVVHRYPDFVASVTFDDEGVFFFDGVKDMFKFLFDLGKYSPAHRRDAVRKVFVTEYYDMRAIDGMQALYVIGSDVFGPMGRELIPLASMEDARQFQKDHQGKRILRFPEVTPALVRQLD